MSPDPSSQIETVLQEERVFKPSPSIVDSSNIKGLDQFQQMVEAARLDPESFWAKDEENYCKAVAIENVEEKLPSKRPRGYISGQWESNTNKPVSELFKECPF